MREIREKMNLSQAALASYMGISRSFLSGIELAERSLPSAALQRANLLLKAIYKKDKPAPLQEVEEQALQTKDLKKLLQERKDRCKTDLLNARAKLVTMQESYAGCIVRLQIINELLPTLTNNTQDKKDKSWLKLLETETLYLLKKCGLLAQQTGLLHIELLEGELAAVERRLTGL